jgi:hypothetical protein
VPSPPLQSQPSRPTSRIPLAPKRQGDRAMRALCCRWTTHLHRDHGTAAAPSLASPMVSPPYHLRHPPPHLIRRCRSKPSPFPPLRAPHRSLCCVTLEPTPCGTTSHQRPPTSAASTIDVPVHQATLVVKPSFIRKPHRCAPKIVEAVSHPPPSMGTSLSILLQKVRNNRGNIQRRGIIK